MVAALTYARRYALFTMVGIAGEDDLDASPDVNCEPAEGHKAVDIGLAPNPAPAPAPVPVPAPAAVAASQFQARKGTIATVREKLGAEESAAIRAQLVRDIETLPEDDLQSRAIAILKAKNRLSADDAKLVDEAFSTRVTPQGTLSEALAADEPSSLLKKVFRGVREQY